MDRDIFISYIEEDGAMARALASELRSLGHTTWTYEEDGVAGISYLTQVHRAIESCRAFVLLASQKSVKAHQVIREVEQAHEAEKTIIAIRRDLTHQQFVASNPILKMATGTSVTLAAGEGNVGETAKRIVAALRFAEQQDEGTQGRESETVRVTPSSSATGSPPVTPTKCDKDSPTNATHPDAVLSLRGAPIVGFKSIEQSNGISVEVRSIIAFWFWLSIAVGVLGQVCWDRWVGTASSHCL